MSELIIPAASSLYSSLERAAKSRRIVLFAGLPGVGKSLFLQQLALLANRLGRKVHLLQWDVTREVFETDEVLSKYPEVGGSTHAVIRRAVGLWAREAVLEWHEAHTKEHLLIGEVPLIGNRLIELVQPKEDLAEALLTSEQTLFLLPVPSKKVRASIEAARKRSIAAPRHQRESADAPPNVLEVLWHDLRNVAVKLELCPVTSTDYGPQVYASVYEHLLRYRHAQQLAIDTVFTVTSSVYDLAFPVDELFASPEQVKATLARIEEAYTEEELEQLVADWYEY